MLGAERKERTMTPVTEAPAVDLTSISSQIASHLDAIQALIPGFAAPDPARRKHVAANARFANDSIAPSITAVQNYPPLQQTNIFDVEAQRYALALRDAVRPQLVRMQAIVDGGNFTIDDHLAESGVQVLQMYNWSQRHLRLAGSDGLRPYADEIGRTIQKAINHRRTQIFGAVGERNVAEIVAKRSHAHDRYIAEDFIG